MDVVIVGDGPGGLSAALFLAKNGLSTVVYGQDKTAMHWAQLRNYLGVNEIHGSEFQKLARQQAGRWGALLQDRQVSAVSRNGAGSGASFNITLEGGEQVSARYVILSEGKSPRLAQELGANFDGPRVVTDKNNQTSVPGVYAVGRSARPGRSQAIISAGDGAVAAIDILSREKGQDFSDWDSPPK
jgi:thioredoxin reductase (NADPH)